LRKGAGNLHFSTLFSNFIILNAMASALKNLSDYNYQQQLDISEKTFGIVVSDCYDDITGALFEGAKETLIKEGAKAENIIKTLVPGTFELSLGTQLLAQREEVDAVIGIGCVIRGETAHFDFICHAVAQGFTEVGLKYNKPVIFGVLTPDNYSQAKARAGGEHGNKGVEAAVAALKMLTYYQ